LNQLCTLTVHKLIIGMIQPFKKLGDSSDVLSVESLSESPLNLPPESLLNP
jgi:hypothetical protein